MLDARIRQGEDFAMLAQRTFRKIRHHAERRRHGHSSRIRTGESQRRTAKTGCWSYIRASLPHYPGRRRATIFWKVISKEPAGQRELNDPRVQQTIRETLLNRKDQLLKAAYFEVRAQ
jgi:peptidyl-prolyl cis-trans isomerase SurA